MKKFIRYMYEYRNGQPVQNVGFVKVEQSAESAVVQIYGKGFPASGSQELEIFLFYLNGEQCIGVPMGRIRGVRPMTSCTLKYGPQDMGSRELFEATGGIMIRLGDENNLRCYVAFWEDTSVNPEGMITREEAECESAVQQEPERTCEPEEKQREMEKPNEPEEKQHEMEMPNEPEERQTVYKITRQDLVNLPRQEWKLANNHFLVHGCRNYHHLVSFEKDGICWLGVPGIYHRQEEQAARAFGFGQFMKPEKDEIFLNEDEMAEHGEFGYWCRQVHNVIKR